MSCDEENANWKYKYTGGKGPKKIFKGTGKLSFTKQITPPHGYDYGMKSGLCLIVDDQVETKFKIASWHKTDAGDYEKMYNERQR